MLYSEIEQFIAFSGHYLKMATTTKLIQSGSVRGKVVHCVMGDLFNQGHQRSRVTL